MFGELLADYAGWNPAGLDAELRRLEVESRALEARRAAALCVAELRQVPAADGHKSTVAYLRATTNQPRGALAQLQRARFLGEYPSAGEALAAGRIGLNQVDEMVRAWSNPRAAEHVDARVIDMFLPWAEHFRLSEFVVVVDRWLMWADQDGAFRDEQEAVAGRTASVLVSKLGVDIAVTGGDALTAEQIKNIFEHFVEQELQADIASRRAEHGARAEEYPLPRTGQQRRFDAIAAIFGRAHAATGDAKLPDPVVNVLCDERTVGELLARAGVTLADREQLDLDRLAKEQIEAVLAEFVSDPTAILTRRCETARGQQIHPVVLMRALLTAQVRRVVLDSRSTVIDFGERQRLFTGNARLAATLLHRTCQHPGCNTPSDRCQVDHNQPASTGGRTDQANAGPECGTHNRHKHRARLRTRRADHGQTYTVRDDGTLILFAGERPPPFTVADEDDARRERIARLNHIRERLPSEVA